MEQMNSNVIKIEYLIVGSRPKDGPDIVKLFDYNGVRAIENLQQFEEADQGDITGISEACYVKGIWNQRVPIHDQDPKSVRTNLPVAVGILDKLITEKVNEPGETVYLHCHEGLGRAPSVAVAYLYWFTDLSLDYADKLVSAQRPGSTPYEKAIREATYDILQLHNGLDNFQTITQDSRTITAAQRGIIQKYVTQLPEVVNAQP